MKRKLKTAILVLLAVAAVTLGVALVVVHSGSFRGWLGTRLASTLTRAAGRPVSLQISDLAPLRLRATVEEFTIQGATPDAPPLVSVARIERIGITFPDVKKFPPAQVRCPGRFPLQAHHSPASRERSANA